MKRKDSSKQCIKCKHKLERNTCKAFPDKIPMLIYGGIVYHNNVIDGQIGEFIYTPNQEFFEISKEEPLSTYEFFKIELPKLLVKEMLLLGYEVKKSEKIMFQATATSIDKYVFIMSIMFENEVIEINCNVFSCLSDILAMSKVIIASEMMLGKSDSWIYLTIFPDQKYEYSNVPFS